MNDFSGTGVSPGVVIGKVQRFIQSKNFGAVSASLSQVLDQLENVANDLEIRAKDIELESAREILLAQALIARDPALSEAISLRLSDEVIDPDVRSTLEDAFSGFRDALMAVGGYFAERVADLDEIAHRLISKLAGREVEQLNLTKPRIIIAEDLTPADTASLNLEFALALVISKGGPTSHTAIVARGLGIPAIVGCAGVLDIQEDVEILVDGRDGVVVINPSNEEVARRQSRESSFRARAEAIRGPGFLRDGTPVTLLANAGSLDDVEMAIKVGAEGIGLFRTELLFLDRHSEPSIEEQVHLYASVFTSMAGKKIIIRTLDAGSDKPVPFINAEVEANPALGVRGWRLVRTNEVILNRQLDAIANAAVQVKNNGVQFDIWVMAPMISTPAEAKEFASKVYSLGLKNAGVMIETPAASLHADKVLKEVDFASLGTNDLSQYVMASDRLDARLSDMTTTWHPAVLRAISIAAKSAKKLGKPIGVCGESAANPQLAAVLIGLGVDSLSMAPSALADVRGFLAQVTSEQCLKAAKGVLDTSSAEEARDLAISKLGN